MPLKGQKPKAGDLIEIDRGFYRHWAVYVGDGYVVHLTGLNGMPSMDFVSSSNVQAVVKKELLKCVVRNCNYWVNNKHDTTLVAYPVPKIIARAKGRCEEIRRYDVFAANCEHFANKMRYNKSISPQADNATTIGFGTIFIIGVGAALTFVTQLLRH